MIENRRSRRKSTRQTIAVTNAFTGEVVGDVGNLSIDGMLLIANRALPDHALYQLSFELPGRNGAPARHLEVGVHEQWTEPAAAPDQFWAGFRIIDIGPDDRVALAAWIDTQDEEA